MNPSIRLLGSPRRYGDGGWATLPLTRPLLLLSYLAVREDGVGRDELLGLFWPEVREAKARQSLRSLLYQGQRAPYDGTLQIEGDRVRCLARSDVHAFREAVAGGAWRRALDLYRGPLLEPLAGDASPAFDAWLEQTRDDLHGAWRNATMRVAEEDAARGEPRAAADLLNAVLDHDILAEDVVRACMRAQAAAGERIEALSTFERFRRTLADELDMEPLDATLALAERIRTGSFAAASAPPRSDTRGEIHEGEGSAAATPSLPRPPTPFIGRKLELVELGGIVARADTRLVTLLGPGGIGKSRLALELLEVEGHRFAGGVAFVPLADLTSAETVPSAVAAALPFEPASGAPVEAEILRYLEPRRMLIALDNLEHLPEAAAFVERLVAAAPTCVFVCTSRVVLGLPGELVYDVVGLNVPAAPGEGDPGSYDAARLFVQSARRVRSDFSVGGRDTAALLELCAGLDGMPLALELAATWVRLYALGDLVAELRRDPDLLEAPGRRVGERHRSLRFVFEQSWRLLEPEAQRVLAALSVFRGSFDPHAARAVTGASARTLLALVDASFLRSDASGRFSLLLVLRQFAAEKLGETPHEGPDAKPDGEPSEDEAQLRERHGVHYLTRLADAASELAGLAPSALLTQLERDLENLRAAWSWALDAARFELCLAALAPLGSLLTARARFEEGIDLLERALEAIGERPPSRFEASVRLELAYTQRRLDRYRDSQRHAHRALEVAQRLADAEALTVEILCEIAHIGCWIGSYAESVAHAERALAIAQVLKDPDLVARCESRLALARRYLGEFDEADRLYRRVLDHARRSGRTITLLRALSDVGRLWVDMGRPHEARALFAEGLERAERHAMPYELGYMWEGLSQCSSLLGEWERAQREVETALRCSEAVNDSMGIAVQCGELGRILLAVGELERAEAQLRRGLAIAWERGELPEVTKLLVTWARALVERGEDARADALLRRVIAHPATQGIVRREARALLGDPDADASTASPADPSLDDAVRPLLNRPR